MQGQELVLTVKTRKPGESTTGIKGVVYGKEYEPTPIVADLVKLTKSYEEAGSNRLVSLKIDDKEPVRVLFQDIQKDPVTMNINHFDFRAVSMRDKLKADIPVHITGETQLVIAGEATLVTVSDTVEVESIPTSLPEKFEIDISSLENIGDQITVADLKAPSGVEIITEQEQVLVKLDAIAEEEEIEEEIVEGEEGEVTENSESESDDNNDKTEANLSEDGSKEEKAE